MESSPKKLAATASRPRPRHDRQLSPNELREYLDGLNEKDPSQLMGAVSQGNLLGGLVLATIIATALLLACTIVPYAWDSHFGQPPLAAAPASSPKTASEVATANAAASATPATSTSPAESAVAGQPAVNKKVMGGVDEIKQSDPNVNPLDSKIDDLFDKTR
jgi:predicted lipid-binding transport protein (Tim44 family)